MGDSGSGKSTLMNIIGWTRKLGLSFDAQPPKRAVRARERITCPTKSQAGNDGRPSPRSLAMNPSLLLADKPTGNLNTQTGIEIMDTFQTLNDLVIPIVMVTHELNIDQYAKRNTAMRGGKILSDRALPFGSVPRALT